ncbi:hypothetical protein [Rhodopseudomonas palustris]|uniref:Uncharacterized protein n=1 Tax=Rhodopseudomonas palustris (strain BisB18) TaxID=316056 RepID=Q212Z5_RHOPB
MATAYRRATFLGGIAFTAVVLMGGMTTVSAQTSDGAAERREAIIIGGTKAVTTPYERCVEVEIGGQNALGCLNQKLRREVERVSPSFNLPPIDARSPDVRVGNANEAAIRQQYGSNYGRSIYPFRPPPPVYVMPRR